MTRCLLLSIVAALCASQCAVGSEESIGQNGIRSAGLVGADGTPLDGSGVNIGQVEPGRVADRGFDSDANSNLFVNPFEIRELDGDMPFPNTELGFDYHPIKVSSVINGQPGENGEPGAPASVSPGASIYSSAYIQTFSTQPENALITTQYIANKFGFLDYSRHIRTINHSWGVFTAPPPDGNSQLTMGLDWIASTFDVLNVNSGSQGDELHFAPKDNYNGLTIAKSRQLGGVFRKVDQDNDNDDLYDAAGDRVSVDLIAPGVDISVAYAGATNPTIVESGTSLAAAHVTGTTALLGQFADERILNSGSPRWDIDNPRRHEVMKAVLLNSADKLVNVHGSTRTVVAEDGVSTWLNSPAFLDDQISLDQQMGAGHLNAARALRQFRSGEYNNGEDIPAIGWDWGETGGAGTLLSYPFEAPLEAGYVAITLAWDRDITKNGGDDDFYDPTNIFSNPHLDDLDLFLVPGDFEVGVDDPYSSNILSVSSIDNVEHIFKQVTAGTYMILVRQDAGDDADFGLAWWTGSNLPGDFDENGEVNRADLNEWKADFALNSGSDADFDGDTDGNDFLVWQRNLGASAAPVAVPVPEPTMPWLCCLAVPFLSRRRNGQ